MALVWHPGPRLPQPTLLTAQGLKEGPVSQAPRSSPPSSLLPGNTVFVAEMVKEAEVPQAALGTLAHGTGDGCSSPTAEDEVGVPTPAPGLLQVTEKRREYS